MSNNIREMALNNTNIEDPAHRLKGDLFHTVIFVVGNRQQIDMFLPLHKHLCNFKIIYIYLANWGKPKCDLENYLSSRNITYYTVGNLFVTKQINSLFERINPDLVVLSQYTSTPTHKIIESAKKFGIPTLGIQDGIYSKSGRNQIRKKKFADVLVKYLRMLLTREYTILEKFEILICSIEYFLFQKKISKNGDHTKIAVFGESTRKMLENEGVDPKKIIVTGSPKFDYLYNYNPSESVSVYTQLDILPNKKTVLLITQPLVESNIWTKQQWKEYVSQLGMLIERRGDCKLIIKIRPSRENILEYKELSKFYKIRPTICEDISLIKLVEICDVAITVYSTGGLETIAAGKPLIIFDPFHTPGSSFYDSKNILFLTNFGELSTTINKILFDDLFRGTLIQKQGSFLKENLCENDGKASERIYNVIIDMIKNNSVCAR